MKKLIISVTACGMLMAACSGASDGAQQSLSPTYACDSAVVNITVMEYDPDENEYIEAITSSFDDLGDVPPVKLDSAGRATMRFDLQGDLVMNLINASADENYGMVRIAPGEVTDITIYPDSIVTTGRFAEFNRETSKYQPAHAINVFGADFFRYDMNGDDYTAAILAKYADVSDSIEADTSLTDAQKVLERANLVNTLLALASDRKLAGRCNYMTLNPGVYDIPSDSIATDMSDSNYASVVAAIDPDDEVLLMGGTQNVATSLGKVDWNAFGASGTLLGALSAYQKAAREAYEGRTDSSAISVLKAYPNRFFVKAIDNIREINEKRFAEAAKLISPTPDVPGEEIIGTIAASYPGKVVLIDRWNTWCSPCKAGIAANEPLKDNVLSDPDIVWVYVADESSPIPAYYKMIPDIRGNHYRLTEEQANAVYEKYKIDGIPYYFLVDRKGVVTPRPDFRDHDILVSAILEELKK